MLHPRPEGTVQFRRPPKVVPSFFGTAKKVPKKNEIPSTARIVPSFFNTAEKVPANSAMILCTAESGTVTKRNTVNRETRYRHFALPLLSVKKYGTEDYPGKKRKSGQQPPQKPTYHPCYRPSDLRWMTYSYHPYCLRPFGFGRHVKRECSLRSLLSHCTNLYIHCASCGGSVYDYLHVMSTTVSVGNSCFKATPVSTTKVHPPRSRAA